MPALVLNIIIIWAEKHDRKSVELQELFLRPHGALPKGRMWKRRTPGAVSYTHLTLPTIYSV